MRRYFFDMTDLRGFLGHQDTLTGIQRVVVMAAAKARLRLSPEAVWLCYYDEKLEQYLACKPDPDQMIDITDIDELRRVLNIAPEPDRLPGLDKYRKRPGKRALKTLQYDLEAYFERERSFVKIGSTAAEWRKLRKPSSSENLDRPIRKPFREVARKQDCLLLLDNTIRLEHVEEHFHEASESGIEIIALLHDLIPIVAPHFTKSNAPSWLFNWLKRSVKYVSYYLANSENTARDLQRFLDTQDADQDVTVVPLAQARLEVKPPASNTLTQAEVTAFPDFAASRGVDDRARGTSKTPFALTVGTREIRKNLWGVARAWQRLHAELGDETPKLVVAGRPGWLNEDFDDMMRATGNLGGWVTVIDDASDADLAWLYERCLFTICASFYEGWGLPVGESLAYGKTAVVSNVASLPEVGRDLVLYCNPHDMRDIAATCKRLTSDVKTRIELERKINQATLRSWSDVAEDIVRATTRQEQRPNA